MAFQQKVIPLTPNTWTPICQYVETRQSLIVQATFPGCVWQQSIVPLVGGAASLPTPLSAYRRRLSYAMPGAGAPASADYIVLAAGSADAIAGNGIVLQLGGLLTFGDEWAGLTEEGMFACPFGGNANIIVTELFAPVRGLLLATAQNAESIANFGSIPAGYWLDSGVERGPKEWRLSSLKDAEIVQQEWFAWPVADPTFAAAGNQCAVIVSESWEIVPTPPPPKFMTVELPQLSPGAAKALAELLARISPPEAATVQPDDLNPDEG